MRNWKQHAPGAVNGVVRRMRNWKQHAPDSTQRIYGRENGRKFLCR